MTDFNNFLLTNQHLISAIGLIITALGFIATIYGIFLGFKKIQSSINDSLSEFKSLARDYISVGDINRIKGYIEEVYLMLENSNWIGARLRSADLYERLTYLKENVVFEDESLSTKFSNGLARCKTLQLSLSFIDDPKTPPFDKKKALRSLVEIKDSILKIEEQKSILREDIE